MKNFKKLIEEGDLQELANRFSYLDMESSNVDVWKAALELPNNSDMTQIALRFRDLYRRFHVLQTKEPERIYQKLVEAGKTIDETLMKVLYLTELMDKNREAWTKEHNAIQEALKKTEM